MSNNPKMNEVVYPCSCCGRKFVQKSLEVHQRACNKTSKNAHGALYNNKEFLDNLDKQIEKENASSSYKSSKKATVDPDKAFLDKLDKEMIQEQTKSGYAPTQPKKKTVVDPKQDFLDKLDKEMANEKENPRQFQKSVKKAPVDLRQDFLDKLDKGLAQEEERSGYAPSQPKKKEVDPNQEFHDRLNKEIANEEENPRKFQKSVKKAPVDLNQDFLDKLDKGMENDAKNPYVPYKSLKKSQEDHEKAFIDRLDQEMEKEDTYKPYQKKNINPKEDFQRRLDQELKKEESNSSSSATASVICHLCFRKFPVTQLANHLKTCETNWRMKNINKDPNLLKPKEYAKIMKLIDEKKDVPKEDIDDYNQKIQDKQKIPTYTTCDNCARHVPTEQIDEHMKKCMPSAPSMKQSQLETQPVDSNKIFQEKLEKELKQEESNSNPGKKSSTSKVEMKKDAKFDLDKMMKDQGQPSQSVGLLPCDKCGRKFNPDRLVVHSRGCKGKN